MPTIGFRPPALRAALLRLGIPMASAAALLAVPLLVSSSAPLAALRNGAFDTLQRLAPRPDADAVAPGTGVVVVDIDEASLARFGQWPWPRTLTADLVGRLQDAGAAAIGLDIVFAEPDRSSPAALAPVWARRHGLRLADPGAPLPDYDADLARTLARGRVVTGYVLTPDANGRSPAVANGVALLGGSAAPALKDFRGAIPNLRAFDEAAAGQGSFSIADSDRDETVRRLPLFSTLNGAIVPAMAVESLRVAQGEDAELGLREERGGGWLGGATGYAARIGAHLAPVDPDGAMWIRFGASDPARTLSAARVLEPGPGDDLAARVRGRIVLVGTSALGLSDLRPTPLHSFQPGVTIHAAGIEQILADDVLSRPFWAAGAELRVAALLGIAVALATAWRGLRSGALALALVACGAGVGSLVAFARLGLLFDPSLAMLAAVVSFVGALGARHLVTERRAGALRTAFGQYLSPHLVDALARDPGKLRLGGEEREMTFLFTDLEGFTSFTESVGPALLVSTLNRYLDGVCAIVLDHGGTIDKIVGDAVHVMFNAPLDQPDHAARAVHCGLAIDAFGQAFALEARQESGAGTPFGMTRIGINTGRAVVGNFGGRRRFDYTAHGDAINTAARLEAANKRLGTRLCASRATVEAVGPDAGLRFRPIGALALKGKAQRVEVYVPLHAAAAESGWADHYGEAFARLAGGDAGGPEAILALLAEHPDDPLLCFHAERIARGVRGTDVALQAA